MEQNNEYISYLQECIEAIKNAYSAYSIAEKETDQELMRTGYNSVKAGLLDTQKELERCLEMYNKTHSS